MVAFIRLAERWCSDDAAAASLSAVVRLGDKTFKGNFRPLFLWDNGDETVLEERNGAGAAFSSAVLDETGRNLMVDETQKMTSNGFGDFAPGEPQRANDPIRK